MAKPLSVNQCTAIVKTNLESTLELMNIQVQGEIVQYNKQHGSGHIYFTLKDKGIASEKSILKCSFFSPFHKGLTFHLAVGLEIVAQGSISVYGPHGTYNLRVSSVAKVGLGDQLVRIQQLRQQLANEGVINPARRRDLPKIPRKMGIVTGLGTAALQDILKQVAQRYPHIDIVIAPATVQGEGAPESLISALQEIAKPEWGVDVILFGRGGGSTEDLLAFDDEKLARVIAELPVPTVSAVGHEIDHPISDDVADYAAATPTAGAQKILPSISEFEDRLQILGRLLEAKIEEKFRSTRDKLSLLSSRPIYSDPYALFQNFALRLDGVAQAMRSSLSLVLSHAKGRLNSIPDSSSSMERLLENRRAELGRNRLDEAMRHKQKQWKNDLSIISEKFIAFSPLGTLQRGYAVVYAGDKIAVKSADLKPEDSISIRMQDGLVTAVVSSVQLQK